MRTQMLGPVSEQKYLTLLAHEYPSVASVTTEIINLKAISRLPKGTEHFISDVHGEYAAFLHMLKNASGVVRQKIDMLFENTVPLAERNMLATLIYYPAEKLEQIHENADCPEEWYRITLMRLVEVCRLSASKYTRSKVRKALPADYAYIIDELLHAADTADKARYNREIICSIVETGRADAFIVAICELIQRLVIDRLHLVGDIFDRGPGAHIVLDALTRYHHVDMQWGNHDVLWMGAAAGSTALMATAIINSLKYGNIDTIEDGYGISLSPLVTFALETYADDPCEVFLPRVPAGEISAHDRDLLAKMHKAMAIILFKLEGAVIRRNPGYGMDERLLLERIDYQSGTITLDGQTYPLTDARFPTVQPDDPYRLTAQETELVKRLRMAFHHSAKLQEHVRFLYRRGSLFLCCNGNLLFHGCVPVDADGRFTRVEVLGERVSGKALFERAETAARQGYTARWNSPARESGLDFMWYLWCGPYSPLFGKDRMTTFERYFVADKKTHTERKNPYFTLAENEGFALDVLHEFGLSGPQCRIINGHVPVKIRKGESPVKANGRIIVIDGGMSRAYQPETGAAGYTLIFNSQGLRLCCHEPFVTAAEAVRGEMDIHSTQTVVSTLPERMRVRDTDEGEAMQERIRDLERLLAAYQTGALKEPGTAARR